MCGVIYRLKNFVNKKAAKNLHYSCVYSIVSYCIATWGGVLLCTHRCEALLRLQSRIIKNLFRKFFFSTSETSLFRELEILKLDDVYKLRVSIYMHRILLLSECPTLLNNLELIYIPSTRIIPVHLVKPHSIRRFFGFQELRSLRWISVISSSVCGTQYLLI